MGKFKHGMSHTRVFKTWLRMIDRCRNDRQGNYGKRGIAVCERWLQSFESFYEDMGEPPSPTHSIDRIDVNGNYEPGNCRWATRTEQARNTTKNTILTKDGISRTIAEWSEITGIKPATICVRLAKGWTHEDALSRPVRPAHIGQPWVDVGMSRSAWYRAQTKP